MNHPKRDPREEKLRDFRHSGNHQHYGKKNCGACCPNYLRDKRKQRRSGKVALRLCAQHAVSAD